MSVVDRARWLLITGFGLGLSPVASGTVGTIAGVVPAVVLGAVLTGADLAIVLWALAAVLFGFGCAQTRFTARVFNDKDPGEFVLDEVVGYLVTVALFATFAGDPTPEVHVAAFLAFRVFDVLKPPPVDRLEELPGAFGIMADDALAGGYAGGVVLLLRALDFV